MPLNVLRLNQKGGSTHPNDRITFIKALPGPTADAATDFLNRIAAQCAPIMRQHHLSVTTLEEHEPNREFVGRNFNSGEVIQLVLHPLPRRNHGGVAGDGDSSGGRWLPFCYVQMVMMHELAHILQMNHSRAFWKLRNTYADGMRALWSKHYTGDGLWGRGQTLNSGQYTDARMADAMDIPDTLCGGAYRSRRRKRKRAGPQPLSHAERKQRWIERKFGKEGQSLGEDEMKRMMLERGKVNLAKPRVAGSKRGRELRAEAVALRLEREQNMKKAEKAAEEAIKREDEEEDSVAGETADECDEGDGTDDDAENTLVDARGRRLVKVCGDEDESDDAGALDERQDLLDPGVTRRPTATASPSHHNTRPPHNRQAAGGGGGPRKAGVAVDGMSTSEDESTADEHAPWDSAPREYSRAFARMSRTPSPPIAAADEVPRPWRQHDQSPMAPSDERAKPTRKRAARSPKPITSTTTTTTTPNNADPPISSEQLTSIDASTRLEHTPSPTNTTCAPSTRGGKTTCPICTYDNDALALTCTACAHVLDTARLPRHWPCPSAACHAVGYVNSEDAGRCGLCGRAQAGG